MMHAKIFTVPEEVRQIWELFSPKESPWDLWSFRYASHTYTCDSFFAVVVYENTTPVGFLPLSFDRSYNIWTYFGGKFMNSNRIFAQSEAEWKVIAEVLPQPFDFLSLNTPNPHAEFYGWRYMLHHKTISRYQYLSSVKNGNHRRECVRRYNKIHAFHPTRVIDRDPNAIEQFIVWNRERFGQESSFHRTGRINLFRSFTTIAEPNIYIIQDSIDSECVSVSVVAEHNGYYSFLNYGVSSQAPKDFRTYLYLSLMDHAESLQAHTFDAGADDCGWKENWEFSKVPLFKLSI